MDERYTSSRGTNDAANGTYTSHFATLGAYLIITIYTHFSQFQSHLALLMRGLRDYIAEQNQEVIVTAIRTLKEELDFDSTAINHLHLAIYLFQTAVNEVLRMHSIKPHWMFALDNLVRNAVQAAITVLSPGEYYFS